jgi:hypothetical protein
MFFIPVLSLFLLFIYQNVAAAVAFPHNLAPYHPPTSPSHIKDRYIVRLRPNHTLEAHFTRVGLDLSAALPCGSFGYMHAINSYHAQLDDAQVHNLIRTDPDVRYVRHDVRASLIKENSSDTYPMEESANNELFRRWQLVTSNEKQPYYVPMTTKHYTGEVPPTDFAVSSLF